LRLLLPFLAFIPGSLSTNKLIWSTSVFVKPLLALPLSTLEVSALSKAIAPTHIHHAATSRVVEVRPVIVGHSSWVVVHEAVVLLELPSLPIFILASELASISLLEALVRALVVEALVLGWVFAVLARHAAFITSTLGSRVLLLRRRFLLQELDVLLD